MLHDVIEEQLQRTNLTVGEFKELIIRLLNFGVLCRAESQTEQQLYDRYLRIHDLVHDYFSWMDVRIYHDARFEYIRVYPPGSDMPGLSDAENNAFGGSLRKRVRQDEVALILVLAAQYDKALHEGLVDDNGFVMESFESIGIALKNSLGRSLPDKITERRRLFQRLKQLRLVQYRNDDDIESGEAWLKIHPMIVSFVTEQALQSLTADTEDVNDISTEPVRGKRSSHSDEDSEQEEDYVS